jgi:hypothetical protein
MVCFLKTLQFQRLPQIRNQVVGIFQPYRETKNTFAGKTVPQINLFGGIEPKSGFL